MRRKHSSGSVTSTMTTYAEGELKPDVPQAGFSTSQYQGNVGSEEPPDQLFSTQTSDGDDSETSFSYKDRRREAHTHAEQKRRDAIKRGYDALMDVVPACQHQESVGSSKLSKATVLQKSIDYVQFLVNNKRKQEEELEKKRKDVMALKIMLANYEHILKTNESAISPAGGSGDGSELPEEMKFRVFQQFMDNLFLSFNSSISVSNFAELSACAINWLEEYCKPQIIKEVMHAATHYATINYRS